MGGIKLSQNEIRKLVEKRGGKYLGEEIINNKRKIKIKCNKCGHIWKVFLTNFKDGDWCFNCQKNEVGINRQKVIDLVSKKGYALRTLGELGLKTRFKVYCPVHNYCWESCYWNFKYYGNSGGTCKLCASGTIDFVSLIKLIESKNGSLIERTKKDNCGRNLIVKCNIHNHIFKTNVNIINRGIWCIQCANEKHTIKHWQIKKLVELKNGTLLDENCCGATTLFKTKCNIFECGREWETSWARIQSGCWCPKCSGFDKYALNEIEQLIGDRGKLLTTKIFNAQQKVDIKCSCGCIFSVHIYNLARGTWCQACQKGYKTQIDLYDIVKDIFLGCDVKYNQYLFDWLRDINKLEIDIWVPELKLAIEYDGKQHFYPVKFASNMTDKQAQKALEINQSHDKLKNTLIFQHPEEIKYFIRIPYTEPIIKENVVKILRANNVPIPKPTIII